MRLNEITEEASVKKNKRGKNQVSRPENSNIKSSRERGSNSKTRERERGLREIIGKPERQMKEKVVTCYIIRC